ncbi:MAG: DinB family protein [Amaricoccus sp.]|uniref:DinB family protein n=1 Tax=Amaricoccus sp. TaxID=1872485 RepID=UPI0039E55491
MSEEQIAAKFYAYQARRLAQLQQSIAKCCDRLTEEQMGRRGGEHENSVANLLLHLAGNLRQWVMHGLAGEPDVRERDEEFALDSSCTAAEARNIFDRAVNEAAAIIAALPAERLLEVVDPQPAGSLRHPTVMEAIMKTVEHVSHHAGQIILLTKQMTDTDLDLSLLRKR